MNPIKQFRLQLGMTQTDLADLAGISQQGVLRYEQSLYEEPSSKLVTALAEAMDYAGITPEYDPSDPMTGHTRNLLIGLYKTNRLEIQREAARYFSKYYPVMSHGMEHPFITWRTHILGTSSRMKFCILLAVHPAVVAEYEKGKRPYMPALLKDALVAAGVGNELLGELDHAGSIYYDRVKHDKTLKTRGKVKL